MDEVFGTHRVEETIHVECMDILRRALGVGELQVVLQQCPNVRRAWVVDRDLVIRHSRTLCEPKSVRVHDLISA